MKIRKLTLLFCLLALQCSTGFGQDTLQVPKPAPTKKKSALSTFETILKVVPLPFISYSTEAGFILGVAKFNVFHLSKKDTISKPSKVTATISWSTKGRINFLVADEMVFLRNKVVILNSINYKLVPEYIFGIGNDVVKENAEQIVTSRFKFVANPMYQVAKNYYLGPAFDLANYFDIQIDTTSFLIHQNISGIKGGTNIGFGVASAYDTRDSRYNTYKGTYILLTYLSYLKSLGTTYDYNRLDLDMRHFFNPWKKHVIAVQATTSYATGDVPFYELPQMGGSERMRGYYQGAFRDKTLIDSQVEYRLPLFWLLGMTGWVGAGRVAPSYKEMDLKGFKISYGFGLRLRADTKNNTNLRFDWGFGENGISGFYISFAEAF